MDEKDAMYVAGIELPSEMLMRCMPQEVMYASMARMENVKNVLHSVKKY